MADSLTKGTKIVLGRETVHGPAVANMKAIAAAWTAILKHEVRPTDVPLMMIAMKLVREASIPNTDNIDDIEGYATILRMVQAKEAEHESSAHPARPEPDQVRPAR